MADRDSFVHRPLVNRRALIFRLAIASLVLCSLGIGFDQSQRLVIVARNKWSANDTDSAHGKRDGIDDLNVNVNPTIELLIVVIIVVLVLAVLSVASVAVCCCRRNAPQNPFCCPWYCILATGQRGNRLSSGASDDGVDLEAQELISRASGTNAIGISE